ncbi:hypothetical protein FOVSG1_006497 [Fusarium oxysporum f. sp. vasinfectum]
MSYTPDAGVMSAMLITFPIATILLVCRLASRKITNVALWWDDYFAVISWVAAALYFSFTIYWATKMGLGHMKKDVPQPAERVEEYARFGLFMAEFTYAMSLGFSKLAILGFYWRLFSVSNIRLGIYILQGSTVIWLTIRTFMTIFHCMPVEAYWNHNIKDAVCRINPAKFMFGTTLVHLMLEVAVLSLPVFQVKSLQLRLGQKIAVVAMFMFGIFGLTSNKGIKLSDITQTKEVDDNSSQRQLAKLEDGSSSDMDFNSNAKRGGHNNTIITSCVDDVPNSNANTSRAYGIQVKNETKVYYEST